MSGTHFKKGIAAGEKNTATVITLIKKFTVSATVAALAADAQADVDVTCTGAQLGDNVIIQPALDATAESGLTWNAWVSAADQVTIRFQNDTTGSLTGSTADWNVLLLSSASQ